MSYVRMARSSALNWCNIAYDSVAQKEDRVTIELLQSELMYITMRYDQRGNPDYAYEFPTDILEEVMRERTR